jgi:hypothetical protein
MLTTRVRALIAAVTMVVSLGGIEASTPKFFHVATQADFLKGDVEQLSIDIHGRLVMGPSTDLVYETTAPFLWTLVAAPDGTLFAGTGNEGKVFRIDAQGNGSLFFDALELEVHALAPSPDGGLYVATSPDGRIYKVGRTGQASTFFEPREKYIWSLAVDAKGNVYAGTGEKGVVYKIGPDGKGAPFCRTKTTHAMALAFDASGNLLVGTGAPGRVLRVDAEGKAFVLLDSPFQEVRALRLGNKGAIYVAALNGRQPAGAVPAPEGQPLERSAGDTGRAPVPSVSTEITSVAVVDVSPAVASSAAPRDDRRAARGAVYRVATDGLWDEIWESRDDSPYDLAFDETGAVVVGTGNKGKLFRLEAASDRPTLVASAAAQQVTALCKDGRGRLFFATANPGKLFRLSPTKASRGTYESEPSDARVVAQWGTLRWRGVTPNGSQMALSTRTGNVETPDETWSPWSAAYANADGSPITSPSARYLQWRAVLSGKADGPALLSVTAAYLQRNLRPQVQSITVSPPGIVFQKPFTTGEPELAGFEDQTTPERRLTSEAMNPQQGSAGGQTLGRRTYAKGLQTLMWKAADENEDDDLVYDVLYRREGETVWKVLRQGLTDAITVWDTSTVPNGTYFVKVVASDSASNPPETALSGELESAAFDIDNTPPSIAIKGVTASGGRTTIAFEVNDDHSPIQRVEFSLDGRMWRAVFAKDGMADSRSERYELTIDGALPDHGIALRATDLMNNATTTQVDAPQRR